MVAPMAANGQFEEFYEKAWGERWPSLKEALCRREVQVARPNAFAGPEAVTLASQWNSSKGDSIPRAGGNLLAYFVMDPGSIHIAHELQVQPGGRVLDLCAAPGGKSLILIEALGRSGEILLNEPSQARRERLTKVIQQYVPRDVRDHVFVTGKDGGLFAKSHPESFDRVLVDAPCSGERYLLSSPSRLKDWKPSYSEGLARRQYALLTAAIAATRPGGRIVFSTCSLSPLEGDPVIRRLLKKKDGMVAVEETSSPEHGEKTTYGWRILPDRGGSGPFYCVTLRRL